MGSGSNRSPLIVSKMTTFSKIYPKTSRKHELMLYKVRKNSLSVMAKCPALSSIIAKTLGYTLADTYNYRYFKIK